jgi:hypothetical protein
MRAVHMLAQTQKIGDHRVAQIFSTPRVLSPENRSTWACRRDRGTTCSWIALLRLGAA